MSDLQYEFCRSSSGSFLVFREKQLSDGYVRKMLAMQTLPFLLEETTVCLDGAYELHYRISGMQTMERRYAKQKMRTADIVVLLDQLVRLRDLCAAYLLPDTHLFLLPDLIYLPHLENDCRFLYLPEAETTFEVQIRALAEFMMKHVSYDRSEDAGVEMAYALQDAVNRDGFDLKVWMNAHRPQRAVGGAGIPEAGGFTQADAGGFFRENTDRYDPADDGTGFFAGMSSSEEEETDYEEGQTAQKDGQRAADAFEVVSITDDWDMQWKEDFSEEKERKGSSALVRFLTKEISTDRRQEDKQGKKKKRKQDTREKEERPRKASKRDRSRRQEKRRKRKHRDSQEPVRDVSDTAEYRFPYEGIDIGNAGRGQEVCNDIYTDETVCLSDGSACRAAVKTGPEALHVLIPMNGGSQIRLEGSFLVIGASSQNADIVLDDPTVSRVHAEIFSDETGIWIEDCNSRNGTLVDGQMLGTNEPMRLESGMRIRMGRSEFVFR